MRLQPTASCAVATLASVTAAYRPPPPSSRPPPPPPPPRRPRPRRGLDGPSPRADSLGAPPGNSAGDLRPRPIPRRLIDFLTRRLVAFGSGGGAAQRLRYDLLFGYDRGTYPWEEAWNASAASGGGSGSDGGGNGTATVRTGLPVEVGINFHRVLDVEEISSAVDLLVWFRQRWVDPRLAWDPEEYGGLTTITFWIGEGTGPGGETSEIWTPDLELWNMEEGLARSLVDAQASVDHTGKVWWSRPGHLRPVCKFKGLDAFPFDTLACSMEIGSWSMSGMYLRPIKMDEGFTVGGSDTAGEAFAAYQLGSVSCREHVYPPYPGDPENDWPVLFYDITFKRSWQPYARGYIMLQIVLNLAAFACFWLPPQCGERMGLAITSMLAAVASELVVAAKLPAASEMTWFARFSITSLMFSAAALFESAAIMYFFYLTSDDLIPKWARWLKVRFWDGDDKGGAAATEAKDLGPLSEDGSESPGDGSDGHSEDELPCIPESPRAKAVRLDVHSMDVEMEHEEGKSGHIGSSRRSGDDSHRVRMKKKKKLAPSQRAVLVDWKEPHHMTGRVLQRDVMNMSHRSFGRDADDYKSEKEGENNRRWQSVARNLDDFSRVFFPLAFAISLAALLGSM